MYFRYSRAGVDLDSFKAFIIIVAVKNSCQATVMPLLENLISKPGPSEKPSSRSALIVASSLASHFNGHRLEGELHDQSGNNNTSLYPWALQQGQVKLVEWLLSEKVVDVEKIYGYIRTPLYLASEFGQETCVQLLLENGAFFDENSAARALSIAAENGHEAVVRLLLERGADMNSKDRHRTPLHSAAMEGHHDVVRTLLERGVSIDESNEIESTALQIALGVGMKELSGCFLREAPILMRRTRMETRRFTTQLKVSMREFFDYSLRGAQLSIWRTYKQCPEHSLMRL